LQVSDDSVEAQAVDVIGGNAAQISSGTGTQARSPEPDAPSSADKPKKAPNLVMLRLSWMEKTALPNPGQFRDCVIRPSAQWPTGQRGLVLSRAWELLHGPVTAGMLTLDGDVAVDPLHVHIMVRAIAEDTDSVHIAPVRLWPRSTGADRWVWGHGRELYTRNFHLEDLHRFTFSFTYLPRDLIEACIMEGLPEWAYPGVDRKVSRVAEAKGFRVNVVTGCQPVHLNF
jgi:hypothetical protein